MKMDTMDNQKISNDELTEHVITMATNSLLIQEKYLRLR